MSSTTQSRDNSSPIDSDAIEHAFNSVWEKLYGHVSAENVRQMN